MNWLDKELQEAIQEILQEYAGTSLTVFNFLEIGGGCINHGGRVQTNKGNYFVKWNLIKQFPKMFTAEVRGLELLSQANAIRIPKVIGTSCKGKFQILILEFINSKSKAENYWQLLGHQLAKLHGNSQNLYGLNHSNYIGSLTQPNTLHKSWIEFFVHNRLNYQLKHAIDNKSIPASYITSFEKLYKKLPSILNEEKPSLLHGDLWSGNLLTDELGYPCLIDPAVYYGNREMDLAMTQLFGGFSSLFYESYLEYFPVSPDLQDRLDIYNLYPLLVHVNLFGQSYVSQVNCILKSFL